MKEPSRKDHDKMTEHELRTEVILLRAKINRLENKPKVTKEFVKKMKAISLKQPWANFIAMGKKTIETRMWKTNYRGELLIVSSKTMDKNYPYPNFLSIGLPLGQALAIVKLIDCRPMRKEDEKLAMCSCESGRYAWILSDVKKIKPFPVKGQLGLYEVEVDE